MEEIVKEFLYWVCIGSGSIFLICLFIASMIRAICILIDHLKVVNVMKEALQLYIKHKRPDLKIEDKDIKTNKE